MYLFLHLICLTCMAHGTKDAVKDGLLCCSGTGPYNQSKYTLDNHRFFTTLRTAIWT